MKNEWINQQKSPRSSNSVGFLSDRSKSGCLRWSLKLIMRLTRQIKKHPLAGCLFIRSSKRLRLHTTKIIITESSPERKFFFPCRLRKFTFGNNGVESTHDALIKYQAMTFGFNITLFCIRSKPSFSSGQTPAYSSWLCF